MRVHVKLGEPLWRSVGRRRLVLEWSAETVVIAGDVVARLSAEYPRFGDAYSRAPYGVFVDAVKVDIAGSSSSPALVDGQTVFILLPAVGG